VRRLPRAVVSGPPSKQFVLRNGVVYTEPVADAESSSASPTTIALVE